MTEQTQAACQDLLDCGNNFIAELFPNIGMPRERVLYTEYLDDFHQGLIGFKAVKEDVARKEIAVKLELEAYQITCEINNNCRQYKLQACHTLIEWISKIPWTKDAGMMSYYFVARFGPNKRTDGFSSEEYALFHG